MIGLLFPLGEVLFTSGALEALDGIEHEATVMIRRHAQGDWGDLDAEDVQANNNGVGNGNRLMSVYFLSTGEKLWIITEGDRSATTILLPDEY